MRFKTLENATENLLYTSRWLMAPLYVGLVLGLLILVLTFFRELYSSVVLLLFGHATASELVVSVLELIDISLASNLVLIVTIAGYENFVSALDVDDEKDKLEWRASTDFATLKLKLLASIIAISAINLLRVFMAVKENSDRDIRWMVVIHVVFLFSGVLLAMMDSIGAKTKQLHQGETKGLHM